MMNQKRVLLIGKRQNVLTKLATALTKEGFAVQWTSDIERADKVFGARNFDMIAFGRGVTPDQKAHFRAFFSGQNPAIRFVDGLAPIIPLLVDQIKQAFVELPPDEQRLTGFTYETTGGLKLHFALKEICEVNIKLYYLDFFFRTHPYKLVSAKLPPGSHTIATGKKPGRFGRNFLVVQANQDVLSIHSLN